VSENDIVVVTGLPRSGTTCMMRMLEAGGIENYFENDKPVEFEESGVEYLNYNVMLRESPDINRMADHDYEWLEDCRGKAVKILTPSMVPFPDHYNFSFIYMDRKIKHIVNSMRKWDKRTSQNQYPAGVDKLDVAVHLMHVRAECLRKLRKMENAKLKIIDFNDLVRKPRLTAVRAAAFLNMEMDTDKMSGIVVKRSQASLPYMLEERIYTNG